MTENIPFMWLSGSQTPDFCTINDFRSKRLKGRINELFANVVRLMQEEGLVSLSKQYIDGTKLESAANRYAFVWRKSVEKHKPRLEEHIPEVFSIIEKSISGDNSAGIETELIFCPMEQHMNFIRKQKNISDLGYESQVSVYQA